MSLPIAVAGITARIARYAVFIDQPLDPSLHRGMITVLDGFGHRRPNWIQVHLGSTRQQRGFVGETCGAVSILEESTCLLIFAIGSHRYPLAQQPHPPTETTQPFADFLPFDGTTCDGLDLRIGRSHGESIRFAAMRAQHQPPPRHFLIRPCRDHIRA
ncbi:hypothetical protein [Allorhodopirellula solitaria]|uniref:hypothetical protein n=1 Tax=Allorhodopirellula solitaria TaxID=2527987 RepID=UPI001FE66FBE|nr:hypothetical protein [Allorhodopirellula solitaria]